MCAHVSVHMLRCVPVCVVLVSSPHPSPLPRGLSALTAQTLFQQKARPPTTSSSLCDYFYRIKMNYRIKIKVDEYVVKNG